MPNIFGRNPRDLMVIRSQCDGMTDRQIMDSLVASGSKINFNHDFSRRNFTSDAEASVAAFGLVSNNLEAVQAEVEEVLKQQFRVPMFIPINSSIPEGATSYSFNVIKRFGKGKFINKDGSNVESATASMGKVIFNLEYAGIEAAWTLQELRNCLFTGVKLDGECLRAATEGALDHIQDIAFDGDAEVGFKGLLNHDEVPVYQGTVPDFTDPATTADIMINFIQALVSAMGTSTNELIYQHFGTGELICVVPTAVFDAISSRKCSDDASRTVANFLAQNNPWTQRTGKALTFKSLPEASDAAETGDGRLILYPMHSRVLEMAIPIMPRIITTLNEGYRIKAPMEYSLSGVNAKRPQMMMYADGVLGS